MIEVWKGVSNYKNIYQISNLGNVKSLSRWRSNKTNGYLQKERILKPGVGTTGYFHVILLKDKIRKTRKIHQLVCEAFLNHIPCGYNKVINHINFNKLDNRLNNLEITTQRKNTNKKHIKYSSKYLGVCWDKKNSCWISSVSIDNKSIKLGTFIEELKASNYYNSAILLLNKYNNNPKEFRRLIQKYNDGLEKT